MHENTSFAEAARRIIVGAENGMENFAAAVMYDSLEECPIDTGTMRRSAKIEHTTNDGVSLHTTFGYGFGDEINEKTRRPAAEYCVPVHEKLEVRHAPPTKAKFLEDPLLLHAVEMGPSMVAAMKAALQFPIIGMSAEVYPVMRITSSGQPILRTPRGPRFGKKS